MNPQVEALYQEIGRQALAEAPDAAGQLLVYAEVEGGVASADMFYVRSANQPVRFRFCSPQLRELVVLLWEKWKAAGQAEWRSLSYFIDQGKFNIDLGYAAQMDPDEELSDRRPRVVQQHFGDAAVDYSTPKG